MEDTQEKDNIILWLAQMTDTVTRVKQKTDLIIYLKVSMEVKRRKDKRVNGNSKKECVNYW